LQAVCCLGCSLVAAV